MDDFDPSILFDDSPTAQEKALAQARVLMGQGQKASQLGALSALMGSTASPSLMEAGGSLGDYAKGQISSAQHGQQLLQQLADRKQQRQLQAERIAEQEKRDERQRIFNERNGNTVAFDPTTGEAHVIGAAAPVAPRGGGKGSGPAAGSALDKQLASLRADIDPASGRGQGQFGKDYALHAAAQRLLALVQPDANTAPNFNLTTRQIPELVQSVAGMLSSGNQAAQGQLEHLMPKTRSMGLAEKLEWLTNHPEEAGVPDFVKQYFETAHREDKGALGRIRGTQLQRLSAHSGLYGTNPGEAKQLARQYLPDLSDQDLDSAFKGQYKAPAAAPAPTNTHWLVSPDGKMRIPAGADGKPIPNAKAEPIPPKEVASRG